MDNKTYVDALNEEIEKIEEENVNFAYELQDRKYRKEASIKNLKIRQAAIRKKIAKFVLAGTVAATVLGATCAYAYDPERIVSEELLADAGLIDADGKKVTGEMTEQELLQYINEKNVDMDEVMEKVSEHLDLDDIDTEYGMEKIESANPGVFEETKNMGR